MKEPGWPSLRTTPNYLATARLPERVIVTSIIIIFTALPRLQQLCDPTETGKGGEQAKQRQEFARRKRTDEVLRKFAPAHD